MKPLNAQLKSLTSTLKPISNSAKLAALVLLLAPLASQGAGDPKRGKTKSVTCAACHGANGISPSPIWPNLKGQKAQYIVLQLKAFKSGARKNPSMSPHGNAPFGSGHGRYSGLLQPNEVT